MFNVVLSMFATDRDMQVLAIVVAATCALPSAFLMLRRMALITDAISHVILLGIVLAFFVVRDLKSPLLLVGAAGGGVVTVVLVELLKRTRLIREDAAIGLVYPALFSFAVVLVSRYLRNTHLDIDAVLVGDLAQAAAEQIRLANRFMLPRATFLVLLLWGVNALFIVLFWKELKLSTFDPILAESLGFRPAALNYVLMTVVSLTVVTAFDAVGPVLVVPLIIVPAATSFLLSDRLALVVLFSVGLAILGAESGFWVAQWTDANFAGAMAAMLGVEFAVAWFLAPKRGWLARRRRRHQNYRRFMQTLLAIHLMHHEGTVDELQESSSDALPQHLHWSPELVRRVISWAEESGWVRRRGDRLELTEKGRQQARCTLGTPEASPS